MIANQNFAYKIIKRTNFRLVLIFCLLLTSFSLIPPVFAPSISFQFATYTLNDGTPSSPVIITVTDSAANLNPVAFDTVTITVTSTTDPAGITLVLTETGISTGIFQNTNLIFTIGNAQYQITDTVTVSINDNSQNASPFVADTTTVDVFSTSDISGISLILSETDISSGIFQGTLAFSSSTSSGNSILVTGGDIVSINYPPTAETSNGLIVPNPNPGIGAIKADGGDTITATYLGFSDFATIVSSGPGSGTGGPIRPGLVLDFIGGLGGCARDCTPPTLGMTAGGVRLVDNGFSYNENPVNVEQYYTPYPLITVEVGKPNVAKLKVFENNGIQNIRHVELGFGLGKGEIISESKAVIEYDINFDGTTQTKLFDPYKVLDNVTVTSMPTKCKLEEQEEKCLEFSFLHTFRESLDFNMVGTNVWDYRRNGWQNYFNEGIEVVGNSLNPPKQIQVLDRLGYPHTITITDNKIGVDEKGNFWYMDRNIWYTEYYVPKRNDPVTMHGIDRNNDKFSAYKQEQILLAEKTMKEITQNKIIQNPFFGINDNSPIILSYQSRTENKELQQLMLTEIKKAEELCKKLWPEIFNKS